MFLFVFAVIKTGTLSQAMTFHMQPENKHSLVTKGKYKMNLKKRKAPT